MPALTSLPNARLDCHLVRTIILKKPYRTQVNSLGVFPDSPHPSPSLFCRTGFMQHPDEPPLARRPPSYHPQSPLSHSRQATLHTGPSHRDNGRIMTDPYCRFIPQAVATAPLGAHHHRLGPPRKWGPRPHAIVDRPTTLTPSISPRLGVESQHQKLHRCALWRIFRPAFRDGGLTRILRHSVALSLIISYARRTPQ